MVLYLVRTVLLKGRCLSADPFKNFVENGRDYVERAVGCIANLHLAVLRTMAKPKTSACLHSRQTWRRPPSADQAMKPGAMNENVPR